MDARARNRIEYAKSGVGAREDVGYDVTLKRIGEAEMRLKFCPN